MGAQQSERQGEAKNHPKQPSVAMQKVGEGQRVELLTAGHGHDEIDMADFKQEQSNETDVKEFFHGIDATCPTNVSQIGWVCWWEGLGVSALLIRFFFRFNDRFYITHLNK